MKYNFYFIILVFLIACNSDKPKHESTQEDSVKTQKSLDVKNKIYFQDKSLYSKAFVSELIEKGYTSPIKIIDDYLLVKGDTVYFPTNLKLNKEYKFFATDSNQNLELKVRRINYTTLNFNLTSKNNDTLLFSKSGSADLSVYFFLASEVPNDDETGSSYGANEYTGRIDNCELKIGIGIGKDEQGRLRAYIDQNCDNKSNILELNGNKTFRTGKNAL
ncbi:hypothetical protein [Pedobacter puniceum]|uniref:Lipoprotein n=1 Tax=Pedobacter puniceum TaxID=2666136 RepID=A0A7K0FJF0_9SPHI|nr:hypothetical protein [Pedobacter puniceum]MRX46104.1 hypothetical protein [Pedobacter puniceum]